MILGNKPEGHNLAVSDGVIQRCQPGAHKSQGKGSEDSPKLYYSRRLGQWRYWRKQMTFREMWQAVDSIPLPWDTPVRMDFEPLGREFDEVLHDNLWGLMVHT